MEPFACIFAVITGVLSHVLYFNHGEHHMLGLTYFWTIISTLVATVLYLHTQHHYEVLAASSAALSAFAAWLCGVYASMLCWRIALNPLNRFPGPFGARLSQFWWTLHIGSESKAFLRIEKLHKKYGLFVRITPNTVSIMHPDAPELIYGQRSKCRKAEWYDLDVPLTSMHSTRIRPEHDKRRRDISSAFSDRSLRSYEQRTRPYVEQLYHSIETSGGGPINVSQLFNFFSYDIMGDLAFGKDFGMLQSGKEHFAVQLLNEGLQPFAFFLPVWLLRSLLKIPGVASRYNMFIEYCNQQLRERLERNHDTVDLMTPVVAPYANGNQPNSSELSKLYADSRMLIIAGSDTTAATLVHLFKHFAEDANLVEQARKELTLLVSEDESFHSKKALNSSFINGCINEALRLHPVVPTALQRLTPPEGLMIDGTFVPGNTVVWCPSYAMGRCDDIYEQSAEFIPERWSSRPDLIRKKGAFFPFSLGPMGCIGKSLALMQLRIVMAKLLLAFDLSYAPGERGTDVIDKSRDHFTIETGPLNLCFTPRKL